MADCICLRDTIIIRGSCPENSLTSTYVIKHAMEGLEENIKGKLAAFLKNFQYVNDKFFGSLHATMKYT